MSSDHIEHDVCPLCSGSGSITYGADYDRDCAAISTQARASEQPPYPEGDVVGPCVCGSWPGGKCLKCKWVPARASEAEDAARYRLLRRGQQWSVINGIGDALRADDLDAALDAARATQGDAGSRGETPPSHYGV